MPLAEQRFAVDKIFKIAEIVKGFLDPQEGRVLYRTALEASRRGPCLEVGTYCGKSALYLGAACRVTGGTLFTVDHHRGSEEHQQGEAYFDAELFDRRQGRVDTFPEFRANLARAGLEDWVVPLVCRSSLAARAWSTPLALLFIDGGHARATVQGDYDCWSPHIQPGGYFLIHDIFPDPAQGGQAPYQIYQAALASGDYEAVAMVQTLGILRRRV